jgi:two-component system chemotaxis sensor kinase CheA
MVVKALNQELADTHFVAGATLLGTGEVVIILNVSDLIKAAQGIPLQRIDSVTVVNAATAANRILIVDDSITTRTLEKNILEAAGYEVMTATHGREALEMLNATTYDLVVSDVEMPQMDGFELTRRIRQSPEFDQLPVILVTSLDSAENRASGMAAGANHYIVKGGFNQGELLQVIRQLL